MSRFPIGLPMLPQEGTGNEIRIPFVPFLVSPYSNNNYIAQIPLAQHQQAQIPMVPFVPFSAFKPLAVLPTLQCPRCPRTFVNPTNLMVHTIGHRQLEMISAAAEAAATASTSVSTVTENVKKRVKTSRQCHVDPVTVNGGEASASGSDKSDRRSTQLICKCPTCGKTFTRHWLLQGHLRTHTGEKPFRCSVCPKAFADKSNLRAHVQTHSGVKPYVCTRCNKRFALKSYLSKHEESTCIRALHRERSGS